MNRQLTTLFVFSLASCARERIAEHRTATVEAPIPLTSSQTVHDEPAPIAGIAIFRAEDIEAHRDALALSDEQVRGIEARKRAFIGDTVSLREDLRRAHADLANLLERADANDEDIVRQTRSLAQHEAELKVQHMQLLLQLRALLTPAQRQLLQDL